jgi:hypothetical protein
MKHKLALAAIASLPLLITACATHRPPQAFHNTDNTALIIDSIDGRKSQIVQPRPTGAVDNGTVLAAATSLTKHQTAVVILENYSEAQIGQQFRDRGTPWFLGLRELGYEHIYFLQGNGAGNPEGLPTLVAYE